MQKRMVGKRRQTNLVYTRICFLYILLINWHQVDGDKRHSPRNLLHGLNII